jgi:small ligand-binding sensory domain FIST
VVGAPAATFGNGRTLAGAAYLFLSSPDGSYPLLDQLFGHAATDRLGTAVAGGKVSAGDLLGDLVASAPFATGAKTGSGVVYVRYGR